jgi:hypothetical protein
VNTNKYKKLIDDFLTAKITVDAFESRYIETFLCDSLGDTPEYEILNELFLDVDAYHGDPDLRGDDGLDEPQLRQKAQNALFALTALK